MFIQDKTGSPYLVPIGTSFAGIEKHGKEKRLNISLFPLKNTDYNGAYEC